MHRARLLAVILLCACAGPAATEQPVQPAGGTSQAPLASQGPLSFADLGSERITRAALIYPSEEQSQPEVPLSLTASDGTGLELVKLEGRAVVDGPIAFTELHLQFRNPRDRVLEGRFQITLPEGASISRLAMRLESGWQEAEIVEKQLARRAYEDFLHRRQDPMLLEKEAGNQFRARIFPIPARGVKDVIVSYSQELKSDERYKLPLVGLPKIDELRVSALVAKVGNGPRGYERVTLDRQSVVPDRDFTVAAGGPRGLRYRDLVAVRVRPQVDTRPEPSKRIAVLFDTSASRAPGYSRQVARLGQMIAGLAEAYGAEFEVVVVAYDQELKVVFDGKAGAFSQAELRKLRARRPLGASDPVRALRWASAQRDVDRVVFVTDGIATAGDELTAGANRALMSKVRRLDVVLVGGIRDRDSAARVAHATLVPGVVIDGDKATSEIVRRLRSRSVSNISVEIPGAEWVWPKRLDGVQAGDEFLVYAAMAKGGAPDSVKVVLEAPKDAPRASLVPTRPVSGPLLQRSAAGAHIRHLESVRADADDKDKEAIKKRIIALSIENRVLSDHTALLVLESEADYDRYGIDRRSLADILVVEDGGLALRQRTKAVIAVPVAPNNRPEMKPMDGKAKPKKRPSLQAKSEDKSGERSAPVLRPPAAPSPPPPPPSPVAGGADTEAEPDADAREVRQGQAAPAEEQVRGRVAVSEPSAERPGDDSMQSPSRNALAAADKQLASSPPALDGEFAAIDALVRAGKHDEAVIKALSWRNEKSGDVMALVALGEALEAVGNPHLAARAYGSIIDLFPSRADLRRFAGARLQRLGKAGHVLAIDSLAKAAKQRPDHLSVHRLYAMALARAGRFEEAFAALEAGLARDYPSGRFAGGTRILREDLGIVAAAWKRAQPDAAGVIAKRLHASGATLATEPSLRFVLNWETDANDVDFHIYDAKGGHAFYSNKDLASGGSLYADVTTGYGPECFTIDGKPSAFPYRLLIHYYSRGPMGYGMGQIEILQHDGAGGLKFEERPFVVMNDSAYVDLGRIDTEIWGHTP